MSKVSMSMYLYGVEASYFKDMSYTDAIEAKKNKAKENLRTIVDKGSVADDAVQLNKVMKAIKHNIMLIKEAEGAGCGVI